MSEIKTYKLGGRTYEQWPLVLGQLDQLDKLLKEVDWDKAASASDLLRLLGEQLPLAAAVVLRPKRPWPLCLLYEPKRKNLRRLAKRLAFDLDLTTSYQVVADFFTCNPVQSFLGQLTGVMQETGALPKTQAPPKDSKPSASCSAEATSASEEASGGESPRPNTAPTCASGSATTCSAKPSSPSSA